jgi:carbon monoxide dehydrogenase subunit G
MTASIGPVKARFNGKLKLSDLNPPNSYSIAFEGSGGAAGFGKGSARVELVIPPSRAWAASSRKSARG